MARAPDPVRFEVGEEESGGRLDQVLAAASGVSRSQVQRWIEDERVQIDGSPCRPGRRVRAGDRIEAHPPEALPAPVLPEAIPLHILYEDADVIVVDKPAGLVVHPAPGHRSGTLVNALLHHCSDLAGVGGVLRPGIVHRLDRGTSGAMVVAKNDESHHRLAAQFHDHSVDRVYLALVRGLPRDDAGRVDRPIGRHRRDRKRMSVRAAHAREAHTAWRVLRRFPDAGCSWLEVRPETGRTHQIRVHLASAGLPIAGDPLYGRTRRAAPVRLDRPALHAAVLGFEHPRSGTRMRFESPLPSDLAEVLARLEAA